MRYQRQSELVNDTLICFAEPIYITEEINEQQRVVGYTILLLGYVRYKDNLFIQEFRGPVIETVY